MALKLEQPDLESEHFRQVAPGVVTFTYDPPPIQSAEEFRKSFAEEFSNSIVSRIEQTVQTENT